MIICNWNWHHRNHVELISVPLFRGILWSKSQKTAQINPKTGILMWWKHGHGQILSAEGIGFRGSRGGLSRDHRVQWLLPGYINPCHSNITICLRLNGSHSYLLEKPFNYDKTTSRSQLSNPLHSSTSHRPRFNITTLKIISNFLQQHLPIIDLGDDHLVDSKRPCDFYDITCVERF